jgi:tetratricopeptide (TPR) repeat protein
MLRSASMRRRCVTVSLNEHEHVLISLQVDCYQRAVRLDQYLAVAYFQQGVSNFLMGDFEEALANFNDTLLYLRGNNNIDYEQLGLKFKLYSCEVLFNRGLCYIYLQQKDAGMQDLSFAAKEKVVPDHDVIDEAINEAAEVSLICMQDSVWLLMYLGLHRLLHPSRYCLPSQRSQGQELENERLPRQGSSRCRVRPTERIHWFCWVRDQEDEQRSQGRPD